jgi:LacI family transcriptional regulator
VSLTLKPGKTRVSEATRRRVMEVVKKLNYVPNLAARNLRVGEQPTIGFLVVDITNPFYSRMVQIVEDTARDLGFQLMIAESRWDSQNESRAISHMIQNRVQGIIGTFCEKGDAGLEMINSQQIPHIAVDTCPPGYQGSYILSDMAQAGEIAVRHLLDQGYNAPVLAMPYDGGTMFSAFARLTEGVKAGLAAGRSKLKIADRIVNAELSVKGGLNAFAKIHRNFPDADSVICASDLCAFGVLDCLHAKGIKPGREFGVLGIDDLDMSSMRTISLTSIREPYEVIASNAARTLISAITDEHDVDVKSELGVELIFRNSTKRTAG